MEKNVFEQFIALINFDQSLHSTEVAIEKLKKDIQTKITHSADLKKTLAEKEDVVRSLRKDVDQKELEMKALDEKEKKARERLASVHNEKEYQSVKDEIAALKKEQHDYEETLMESWNVFETAQKEFELQSAAIHEQQELLEQGLESEQNQLKDLQKKITDSSDERKTKESLVPAEWLEKYGRMRNSVPNPVVGVVSGSCNACFYKISDQDLLLVNRFQLIQCKGCYRFLYHQPLSQEVVTSE